MESQESRPASIIKKLFKRQSSQNIARNQTEKFNWSALPIEIRNEIMRYVLVDMYQLYFGLYNGTIIAIDLQTGTQMHQAELKNGAISCMAVLPSDRLAAGTLWNSIFILDPSTGLIKHKLGLHSDFVNSLICHGKSLISGSRDQTIRIWNNSNGNQLACITVPSNPVDYVAVYSDKQIIATCKRGAIFILKDLLVEEKILQSRLNNGLQVTFIAPISDRRIISGSNDRIIRIWDTDTDKQFIQLQGEAKQITAFLELPENRLCIGTINGKIYFWNSFTGELYKKIKAHKRMITALSQLPNDHMLSGSEDKTVRIWDAVRGVPLKKFKADSRGYSWLTSAAYLPWRIDEWKNKTVAFASNVSRRADLLSVYCAYQKLMSAKAHKEASISWDDPEERAYLDCIIEQYPAFFAEFKCKRSEGNDLLQSDENAN